MDFVVGDHIAVEVKARRHVAAGDLKGLRALADEKTLKRLFCMSMEPRAWVVCHFPAPENTGETERQRQV